VPFTVISIFCFQLELLIIMKVFLNRINYYLATHTTFSCIEVSVRAVFLVTAAVTTKFLQRTRGGTDDKAVN